LTDEPVAGGPAKGEVVDLQPMLDEYYLSRGWDADQALERSADAGSRAATA